MIKSVDATIQTADPGLPTIQGVHLYGPYFTPEKSGCHRKEGCRAPVKSEFEAYFKAGPVSIATCAAELDGCSDFYRYAKKRGQCPSLWYVPRRSLLVRYVLGRLSSN
jgi:N-acetylglucosamine-6-phosphate deacetylase